MDEYIVLLLITETFTNELLTNELVIFESNVVEFSRLVLMMTPLVAEALRNVLLDTNVPTKVTLVRIEPAIVLFSTRLFVIVELLMFTLNARTVSRLDLLITD